ncbi:Gfo/Idh/MocA family protein [Halocatena halophila]|uniref:Gfo/Idh/MocA family protein n=1 Tax=Halocatena halophila TaxID=2814576 RepID=UPI002ED35C50
MTSVGYIGLDHHHREPYLETIRQLGLDVTAVAGDPDVDVSVSDQTNRYREYETLLAAEAVDLVWITASNRTTPAVIREAVKRDIDVFCEKPGARTTAELAAIAPDVYESDATVGFAYAWRGHPHSQQLRQLASDGFYGNLRAVDCRFVASRLATRDHTHYLYDPAQSRGGIVQWLGVHWIDLLGWILDERIETVAASLQYGTEAVEVEDGAIVQFETESGATGSLTCGYYLGDDRYDTHIDILGDRGRSQWEPISDTFAFEGDTTIELETNREWRPETPSQITHEYTPANGYGGAWGKAFIEEFLAACDDSGTVPADIDDAIEVLSVLDAIYAAANSDRWVPVERH